MSNGIYLTLEQYKDKDLPITIMINGNTYHSQFALATTQTTWFEMGKQHGMGLGSGNTYSDKEMSRMHDSWYNEGYADGYKQGNQAGGKNEGYGEGYNDGYEQCKHDGISKKEIPGEYLSRIEEARLEGYKEGYSDAKEGGQAEGYIDGPEQTEYAKGYDEGKAAGYEEGFERGFMDLKLMLKK